MKKVLYTCLVGNYDTLHDPEVVDSEWDYVCFSDHLHQDDFKVWQILPAPKIGSTDGERSRFPKLCPHRVLPDHEISLYIDSNIIIKTDFIYRRSQELENDQRALISIPLHPTRDCLYKEAEILKFRGKDSAEAIDKQIGFLRKEGFPENFGLHENNVIWRRHMHPEIIKVDNLWWEMYMTFAKRDQLGLVYCLWKYGIECVPLMPESIKDHRKCEHFEFTKHRIDPFFHFNRWRSKLVYLLKNGERP